MAGVKHADLNATGPLDRYARDQMIVATRRGIARGHLDSPAVHFPAPISLTAVAIAAVTFVIFSPLLRADFTAWDDPQTLSQNLKLHPPGVANVIDYWTTAGEAAPMGLYVPVTYTVWSAASIPDGPTPLRIHAINLSLHAVTAALVFLLLTRFAPLPAALIGSALFALHPVQVEAVGWASGTKDLLCGFFSVLVLLIETEPGRSRAMRTLSFACFLSAMLSKPTAMVLPGMLVAFDLFAAGTGTVPGMKRFVKSALKRGPWLVGSLACAICTTASQPVPWQPDLPPWTRPIVAADAIAFYLGKLVWPTDLCAVYGRRPAQLFHSPAVWWTWSVPVLTGAFLLFKTGSPRQRRLRFAAAIFLLPLLPVLGLIPFDFQYFSTVADHYLYLPMVGVALTVATLVPGRPSWKFWFPAIAAVVALLVLTFRQESTWTDTRSLAGRMIATDPETVVGHDLLGYTDFLCAREAKKDGHPAVAARRFSEAVDQYRQALANDPAYVPSLTNLAEAQRQAGLPREALATLHRLVDLQQTLPPGLRDDPRLIGRKLIDYGDPAGAVRWLQNVIRQNPSDGVARTFLSEAVQREAQSTTIPTGTE